MKADLIGQKAQSGEPASALSFLPSALEALGGSLLLLDAGVVVYLTPSAEMLLGSPASGLMGASWEALWSSLSANGLPLTDEPQRTIINRAGLPSPVRAWQRPIEGTTFTLVGLEDLSEEDGREREVLRIFQGMQEQADDLFALYQITQFLNTTNELDQLCSTFLRELERITLAETSCLYLAKNTEDLQPKAWHGLSTAPPPQAGNEPALAWFALQVEGSGLDVLPVTLMAEDRQMGLVLLAHRGHSQRETRFLQTVAKEMGTALLVMEGRQALRTQEQKLEAIVDSTTDAIIQVDADGHVRDFNPAAERLTGYAVADALTRSCSEILGCSRHSGCGGNCPFVQVLSTGEPIPYAEIAMAGREGQRHVAASVAVLDLGHERGAGGASRSSVGILRDVTRQKQIEQMKADFLTTVSHQLRTPLALLRGYVDTLLHLDLSEQERAKFVAGIGDTTVRLEQLVAQILDVTRIEEGHMELQREHVRLVDMVRRAITALPRQAYPSRVWAEVSADLPLLDVDPQRFEQVLINLLDNALKYSPPAGQVIIKAEQSGRRVLVRVLDEGIGIPPEEQADVFDKFHRASNARDLQLPGTGLGLFICRSIVQAHGGQMSVSSTPGKGTVISFWVPVLERE